MPIKQEPISDVAAPDLHLQTLCDVSKMADHKPSLLKSTKLVLDDANDQQLTSWTSRHPKHWSRKQVLDWIYYVVDQEHLDGSKVRGEAYQCLSGSDLCHMGEGDFLSIDPDNGASLYRSFRHLINDITFVEPKPAPASASLEDFNKEHCRQNSDLSLAVCSEAFSAASRSPEGEDLVINRTDSEMLVDIPSLGTYSISPDIEFPTTPAASALFKTAASKLASSATFTSPAPPDRLGHVHSISHSIHAPNTTGHVHPVTHSSHAYTSPGHAHSSPGYAHGSPGHAHNSPGHAHNSPGNAHSSPGHAHNSPDHAISSPGHAHISPGHAHIAGGHLSPRASYSGMNSSTSHPLNHYHHLHRGSNTLAPQGFTDSVNPLRDSSDPREATYTRLEPMTTSPSSTPTPSQQQQQQLSPTSRQQHDFHTPHLPYPGDARYSPKLKYPAHLPAKSGPPYPPPMFSVVADVAKSYSSTFSSPYSSSTFSESFSSSMMAAPRSPSLHGAPSSSSSPSSSVFLPHPQRAHHHHHLTSRSMSVHSESMSLNLTRKHMSSTSSEYSNDDSFLGLPSGDHGMPRPAYPAHSPNFLYPPHPGTSGAKSPRASDVMGPYGQGHGGHGAEGVKKKSGKKNRTNSAKNNHLWEFVRDLLHDPKTNPKLLQWEDKERGVFRFVQSDKVADLWGQKKNNKDMTYEKLSRAMRFCRTAGYFASVPKNEKFPKKLCFMFGHKAHSWKQT